MGCCGGSAISFGGSSGSSIGAGVGISSVNDFLPSRLSIPSPVPFLNFNNFNQFNFGFPMLNMNRFFGSNPCCSVPTPFPVPFLTRPLSRARW